MRFTNKKKADPVPPQGQAGMTLVEVVMALGIAVLTIAGIVTGYVFCNTYSIKDSLYMAANTRAMERMEQARSAQWDTSSYPVVDELVASNFPVEVVALDKSTNDPTSTSATLTTTISQISTTPPLRRIHVDCVWRVQGGALQGGEMITNSIETCRAPDQ